MATYYSPAGNPEVWDAMPEGYVTEEEWIRTHPVVETPEERKEAARRKAETLVMERVQESALQTAAFSASEFAVLATAEAFPLWAAGEAYAAGRRIQHEGVVYEVVQDVTALENQPPDAEGMLAVYRPLSIAGGEESTGTAEDPIPFIYGMDVLSGKYYSYGGKLYLARADMKPCVWNPDTAGLWQWEEVT